MVQYLVRGTESHLMVHMRSSDVDGLLPIDLVNLAAIHQQIDEVYGTKVTKQIMHVNIGSAHYYILGGRE
jgi:thymidylate synthase